MWNRKDLQCCTLYFQLIGNYKKGNCYYSRSDIIINMPSFTRFSKDVEWMTGRKLNLYWQITWRFISPLLLLIVFMAFVILQTQKPPSYTAWNPKYVCCQIFLELLIKGRIIFLPYQIP